MSRTSSQKQSQGKSADKPNNGYLASLLAEGSYVLRETYITAIKPRGAKAGPPDNKSESKVG